MEKKINLLFGLIVFFTSTTTLFSQDLSPERKIYMLKNLQNDLFKLNYDMDYIQNTLFPETLLKRIELAPHYPDVSSLERNQAVIDSAFLDWVSLYPGEYNDYVVYLRLFIHAH